MPFTPPLEELVAPDRFIASWNTSAGVFETTIHRAWSPHGVDRIYSLIRGRYYDDTRFYRVIDGWVAQFGVSGDPPAAASLRHARIPDDPIEPTVHNDAGFLTYSAAYNADASVATNRTTELFLNLADHRNLDPLGFTPVGEVTSGFCDVVLRGIYDGYGEMADTCDLHGFSPCIGPNETEVYDRGNRWLDRRFPKLTKLHTVAVLCEGTEGEGGTCSSSGGGNGGGNGDCGDANSDWGARLGNPTAVAVPVLVACALLVLATALFLRRPDLAEAALCRGRKKRGQGRGAVGVVCCSSLRKKRDYRDLDGDGRGAADEAGRGSGDESSGGGGGGGDCGCGDDDDGVTSGEIEIELQRKGAGYM